MDIKTGLDKQTVTKTANYTLVNTDYRVDADTDSNVLTFTLPAGILGTVYEIGNVGVNSNDLTITPNGTDDILGNGAGIDFTLYDSEGITIQSQDKVEMQQIIGYH